MRTAEQVIYGHWGEHPEFNSEDWRFDVANGDTREGYWEWVSARIEEATDEEQDA